MEKWLTDNWVEIAGVLIVIVIGYLRLDQRSKSQRLEFNELIVKYSEESIARNKRLEGVVDRSNQQIADLKTALSEQNDANEQQRINHAKEIQNVRNEAEQQAGEFRKEIQDYQRIALDEQTKNETLRHDVDELTTKVEGQKALIDGMAKDMNDLRGERDTIKTQLEAALSQLEIATKTIGDRDTTINALNNEKEAIITQFQGQIDELRTQLTTKDNEIRELQSRLELLELQKALEEPAIKEAVNEPAPTHPPVTEVASAESAAIPPAADTNGGAAA